LTDKSHLIIYESSLTKTYQMNLRLVILVKFLVSRLQYTFVRKINCPAGFETEPYLTRILTLRTEQRVTVMTSRRRLTQFLRQAVSVLLRQLETSRCNFRRIRKVSSVLGVCVVIDGILRRKLAARDHTTLREVTPRVRHGVHARWIVKTRLYRSAVAFDRGDGHFVCPLYLDVNFSLEFIYTLYSNFSYISVKLVYL